MNDSEPFQRARASALRSLARRPRSEAEIAARLARGYPPGVVDAVIDDLAAAGHTDDAQFAALWTESRSRHNPRSASTIRRELLAKGIDRDLAESAVSGVDDDRAARVAGAKHARRLRRCDRDAFRSRMWAYLRRRGFSPALSRSVTDDLWDETRNGDDPKEPMTPEVDT